MPSPYDQYPGQASLGPDGQVPDTRLADAEEARSLVQRMVQADNAVRARKRALVKGLVDGNPPYRLAALRAAGRSDACNVNWRMAESFLNDALSAFYDMFSEAPTYATVTTDWGDIQHKKVEWSNIITEEFDRLQRRDDKWDYYMQTSQYEMVLYGVGPMFFQDKYDWRCRSAKCEKLMVMENTQSDASLWELAVVRQEYKPSELYTFIRDPEAATAVGWDVEATKLTIINAHPKTQNGGIYLSWEWHQQQLKNGSYYYDLNSKVIMVAHIFCKEFPKDGEVEGKITHSIVQETLGEEGATKFLYQKIGRFDNWAECLHPMYYDHGGGGDHHSVTGMGVKMYGAMEYQNRLLCDLADKAFAPKILFKPTTSDQKGKLSVAHFGPYGVLPTGLDAVQQTPINGMLQDGIGFNNELSGIIATNLSQYRQNLESKEGNPITATEANVRASDQARLGKTQLNRYYAQLDGLFAEKFRRAANPNIQKENPGGEAALEFQQRCFKRGVPREALARIDSVQATRIIGQGSMYMRIQILEKLLAVISMLPENGRDNLISDYIAAQAGQQFVDRYYDVSPAAKKPTDQNAFAMSQVGDMKVGLPAIVTDSQNPVIYASTFLQAASQAAASLKQGADPGQVFSFLELCGPAIQGQLAKLQKDPTRKAIYKALNEQFMQLAQVTDSLQKHLEQQADQQQQGQDAQAKARQQALKESLMINYADAPPEIQRQIEAMIGLKPASDPQAMNPKLQLEMAKGQQQLQHKQASQQLDVAGKVQSLHLADATAASKIKLDQQRTQADIEAQKTKAANAPKPAEQNA